LATPAPFPVKEEEEEEEERLGFFFFFFFPVFFGTRSAVVGVVAVAVAAAVLGSGLLGIFFFFSFPLVDFLYAEWLCTLVTSLNELSLLGVGDRGGSWLLLLFCEGLLLLSFGLLYDDDDDDDDDAPPGVPHDTRDDVRRWVGRWEEEEEEEGLSREKIAGDRDTLADLVGRGEGELWGEVFVVVVVVVVGHFEWEVMIRRSVGPFIMVETGEGGGRRGGEWRLGETILIS